MALKFYQLRFGGDVNPSTTTGLSPTFTQFRNIATNATLTAPGISELYAGNYIFQYDAVVGTQRPVHFRFRRLDEHMGTVMRIKQRNPDG